MVPQIHPGIDGQNRHWPRQEIGRPLILDLRQSNPLNGQESEVSGEEEHVLGVAGGPTVGIAHLEESACFGPGLLDRFFDDFVDELGNEEAEREEHALEFTAEYEVGNEAA